MASQARGASNRTGRTSPGDRSDWSDRQEQPVRPVKPVVKHTAEVNTSALRDEVPAVPAALGDEELVDYEASPSTATWR